MPWKRELKVERLKPDLVRVEVIGTGIMDMRQTAAGLFCCYFDLDHPAINFSAGEKAAVEKVATEEFTKSLPKAA